MEDKEDPTPKTGPGFQGKSGWMKKAHGRILLSYKDRYITVDKTEILVYENEDKKNCLERVDLENYDKCHEMKTGFKKKHRLVLLRSPKTEHKVHDMKFQAQSAEEKEAWIKALRDGINRAKNKIFDEVKVGESSNLEHVTRSRPKANRGRRPPTRIHMKEVADVSSDGILRLDLDLENAMMPNGTHSSSSTAVDGAESQKESTPSSSASERTEDKALSTIKEAEDQDQTEEEEPEKKNVKPPASPSKEVEQSETKTAKTPKASPDPKKKVPPMPPNKPLLSIIVPQDPSPTKTPAHPPSPPSKTKKPTAATETNQEAAQNGEKNESEKDIAKESRESSPTLEKSPKLPPKPENRPKSGVQNANVETEASKVETPETVASESVNLSPLLGHTQGDNGKKAEEKSVDSGQHSDDNSEDSACEDVSPTRDSNSGLDELDGKSGSVIVSIDLKPQMSSNKGYMSWVSEPPTPLKPQEKMRSVSSGNLLMDSCEDIGKVGRFENREVEVKKLENEVAMEMEDTSVLLNRASKAQTFPKGGKNPEYLLAEALEKLKKADHVLREVRKLKLAKDSSHRKSW